MKILLLGASGSIGQQTIDVINKNPQDFTLVGFSVGNRTKCIRSILLKHPEVTHVFLRDKQKAKQYSLRYSNVKFLYESKKLHDDGSHVSDLITLTDCEMVVNALVGYSGLHSSLIALENDKKLALANKESLVVAGELINNLLDEGHGELFPIDSEHSALWKCLKVQSDNVDKMVLTASGGAFRHLKREELIDVKAEEALKHPTWKMGPKITIDCATMVNKCFEIIEAGYLYRYPYDKIGVMLHDESHLHSYILYKDGLFRGEISKPDMRNPIKFALYEGNIPFQTQVFKSLNQLKGLHFHEFNLKRYPLVSLARTVLEQKGTYGAVLNAANEVAVHAYLRGEIQFLDIEKIIFTCMNNHDNVVHPTLKDIENANLGATLEAQTLIRKLRRTEE